MEKPSLRNASKGFACLALAAVLAALPTVARASNVPVTAASDGHLSVLVLGDSYSAGNGAGNYYGPSGCRRSYNNYGAQFASLESQSGHPTIVSVAACSGAVTSDYFNTDSEGRAAQRNAVNSGYNVIFLTFGGNDAKFADLVQQCLVGATDNATKCANQLAYAESMINNGNVGSRITAVLSDVESRASQKARIVLLGYPYLERTTTLTLGKVQVGRRLRDLQVNADQVEANLVSALNARYSNQPFSFVATSPLFEGNESWLPAAQRVQHELSKTTLNPNRWMVNPFNDASLASTDTWYHPNPTGWSEEGALLARSVSVTTPTPAPAPTPPPAPQPPPPPSVSQYANSIVKQTNGQSTAWWVTNDLKRLWIPDGYTYEQLVSRYHPNVYYLSSDTLNRLPDQSGQWAASGASWGANRELRQGMSVTSNNGIYTFVMQGDGNLVLYNNAGRALWASNTVGRGEFVVFQGDGNLVVYTEGGQAVWNSGTGGRGATSFNVQDDGNLVEYGNSGAVWASGTSQARSVVLKWGQVSGHTGPGDNYAAGPLHPQGSSITILCYVNGAMPTNRNPASGNDAAWYNDNMWDRATDGYYYSDAWLETHSDSAVVPHC